MLNPKKILVMGVGNTLMQDDGAGIRVTELLEQGGDELLDIVDGGTIGLSLLPRIEDADAVIVVDASELGEAPGTVRTFRNEEIDLLLSARKRTVHEVALLDLFAAAALRGRAPAERTLVAIQPGSTELGLESTPGVLAAIPRARDLVVALVRQWRQAEVVA